MKLRCERKSHLNKNRWRCIKENNTRRTNEKIINLPTPYGSNQEPVIASVQSDKRVDISKMSPLNYQCYLQDAVVGNENCRCKLASSEMSGGVTDTSHVLASHADRAPDLTITQRT